MSFKKLQKSFLRATDGAFYLHLIDNTGINIEVKVVSCKDIVVPVHQRLSYRGNNLLVELVTKHLRGNVSIYPDYISIIPGKM